MQKIIFILCFFIFTNACSSSNKQNTAQSLAARLIVSLACANYQPLDPAELKDLFKKDSFSDQDIGRYLCYHVSLFHDLNEEQVKQNAAQLVKLSDLDLLDQEQRDRAAHRIFDCYKELKTGIPCPCRNNENEGRDS